MSAPCVEGVQMICLESEDILKNESNKNEQDHICEIKASILQYNREERDVLNIKMGGFHGTKSISFDQPSFGK